MPSADPADPSDLAATDAGPARWPCLSPAPGDAAACRIAVAAVPGSRRAGADGLHDGCLRVRVAAPAVDGKANDALLAWLAAELGLPRRGVRLLRGAAARRKLLEVDAVPTVVARWLAPAVGVAREPTA